MGAARDALLFQARQVEELQWLVNLQDVVGRPDAGFFQRVLVAAQAGLLQERREGHDRHRQCLSLPRLRLVA